jgi:hypothetical protein
MSQHQFKRFKKKAAAIFFGVFQKKSTLIFLFGVLFLIALVFLAFFYFRRQSPSSAFLQSPPPSSSSTSFPSPSPTPISSPNQPPAVSNLPAVSDLPANIIDPTLSFGTFFDTFSGTGFLDSAKATLYQDKIAAAIFFPPDYSWQASAAPDSNAQEYFKTLSFNNFSDSITDRRCLKTNCLEQKNRELYYNGRLLSNPEELQDSEIAAVSIGSLTKNFLIGFTIKNAADKNATDKNVAEYRGAVFSFDGQKFTPLVPPEPIVSPYFGLFGFGGEEDDFLVIYGAYQGIAYRFQGNKIIDLSRFFDIRVMNKGFKAEVIKTSNGDNVNWYIFSSTRKRPWLIKLWQNRSAEIVGEAVFNNLFTADDDSVAFKLQKVSADKIIFLANIKRKNQESYYLFTDRGFKNESPGALFFKPIYHSAAQELITIEKLALARLDLDTASLKSVKFLFSADNKHWQKIPAGKNIDFSAPPLKKFFLQVTFSGKTDKFYSPFLASALFDYYCRK